MTAVPFSAPLNEVSESHYLAIVGQASAFAEPQRQISHRSRNNSLPSSVSQSTDAKIEVSWRDPMHCPGRPPGKSKEFELLRLDKRLNPVRRSS